jgi:hypothetical protein
MSCGSVKHLGKQFGSSLKCWAWSYLQPSNSTPRYLPTKKGHGHAHKNWYAHLTATFFTRAKKCRQPRCPPAHKHCALSAQWSTAQPQTGVRLCHMLQWRLMDTVFSERSQTQKAIYCVIQFSHALLHDRATLWEMCCWVDIKACTHPNQDGTHPGFRVQPSLLG